MKRLLLLLSLLAPVVLAGCQASSGVYAEHDTPHDYRLSFRHGSYVKKAAVFHAVLTLEGGREIWVSLDATNGELAAAAATRWAEALNARQHGLAESSSNTLVLRRLTRIEIRGSLRGVRLKEIGESL